MQTGYLRRQTVAGLAATLLCPASAAVAAGREAVFGIMPGLAPEELVRRYLPLCAALEPQLGPMTLRSAPDSRTFFKRLRAGLYDVALTPIHLAARACFDVGYVAVWQTPCAPTLILITHLQSGIEQPKDLRGRWLALPAPLSLPALLAQQYLRMSRLNGAVYVRYLRPLSDPLAHVARGLIDAAFLPQSLIATALAEAEMRVVASLPSPLPLGPVMLAHPRLPAAVPALQAIAAEARADPEPWATLFFGPFRPPQPIRRRDLAMAAALLAAYSAGKAV